MKKKLWFKAKRYGWGWYPATREGWLVTAVALFFAILVGTNAGSLEPGDTRGVLLEFLLPLLVVIYTLILICYAKGEKPSWRWGDKK